MDRRWLLGWALALGACGDDTASIVDDGTSTGAVTDGPVTNPTDSTTTPETDTGSDTAVDPDTSTGADSTGAVDSSGSDESSTGDSVPVDGQARVLVHASLTDGPADALYRIDYADGVAGEPELVSGAVNVTSAWLSPGESIVLLEDGAGTVHYASLEDGVVGPVMPVHQAPAPAASYYVEISADDSSVAYSAAAGDVFFAAVVDGVIQAPVLVANDAPNGTPWTGGYGFSSDGALLGLRSGFGPTTGPGAWLASVGADPPELIELSGALGPKQQVEAAPVFAPGDEAVWFASDEDGPTELYLAEASVTPAAPPVKISGALTGANEVAAVTPSPDGTRLVFLVTSGLPWGELFVTHLDGLTASPPLQVSAPGSSAHSSRTRWSPDQRWLGYLGTDDDITEDVYVVDMSGPLPSDPILVSLPGMVSGVEYSLEFGASASWLYFRRFDAVGDQDWFRVDVSGAIPGPPQSIVGDSVSVLLETLASSDGDWLAFTGLSAEHDAFVLMLVDGTGDEPGEPVLLSDPRDGSVDWGAFSADASAVLYETSHDLYAVDRDAPGESVLLATGVEEVWVL